MYFFLGMCFGSGYNTYVFPFMHFFNILLPLSCVYFKRRIIPNVDYARDRVNSDERVPRGAYSSGIALAAIKIDSQMTVKIHEMCICAFFLRHTPVMKSIFITEWTLIVGLL